MLCILYPPLCEYTLYNCYLHQYLWNLYFNVVNLWPLLLVTKLEGGEWANAIQCWIVGKCGELWRVSLTILLTPSLFTCRPFIRVVRSSIVQSHNFIWNLKNLFVESLVCLSIIISCLSFSSYGFHSCDYTCVKCYPLGLLYNPIK